MDRRKFLLNMTSLSILSTVTAEGVFGATVSSSDNFVVEQIEYKGLAHFSYIIRADQKIILIDPRRDPQIYYDYAAKNNAKIVGVIETHPHADFVSSHLEIHKKLNVPVYVSSVTKPEYRATSFDDGQTVMLSDAVGLRSMFTPGHAPDHISAVLFENGKDIAVFSGDSLLIGDVGRPDLRDFSHDVDAQRRRLAGMMYDTIHGKFSKLHNDVIVYPAHGAGTLCGKSIRKAASSTIGYERENNHAFRPRMKAEFVEALLNDQPFIPKYFQYNVRLNIKGAPGLRESIEGIERLPDNYKPDSKALIIDTRPQAQFRASFLPNAINIQSNGSFETWLGALVPPDSVFYLVSGDDKSLGVSIEKAAAIGYESNIKGAFVYDAVDGNHLPLFDGSTFSEGSNRYTHIDVRTAKEVKDQPVFTNSINIPLHELPERISEIPTDKPVLVNCASGYRSATASSIIKKYQPEAEVIDLSTAVTGYIKNAGKK